MVVADGQGIPLAIRAESATPAEVTLLEATMDQVPGTPKRLVADRGYDSDPLRERMSQRGTELICPYRRNNRRRRHHDGRKLRRYKHRWIVERTISWLGNYRRVLIRWERNVQHYLAFVHVACLMIALRQL
jgi:transposase